MFKVKVTVIHQVFHNTLWLVTMHHQTKGGNERIISSENVETDVFWLHDCSLWSWPWRQQSFSKRHSSSRWSTPTQSLATRGLIAQKVLSGQTFNEVLSLCYDLDLRHSNFNIFTGHSGLYRNRLFMNGVWLSLSPSPPPPPPPPPSDLFCLRSSDLNIMPQQLTTCLLFLSTLRAKKKKKKKDTPDYDAVLSN